MLLCKVTGFLGETSQKKSNESGRPSKRAAFLEVVHGRQRYCTQSFEVSSLGTKCFVSTPSSSFEIVDCESTDDVQVTIFLKDSSERWVECAVAILSMSEYRSSPEQRYQKSVSCTVVPTPPQECFELVKAEIGLSLVYSHDIEHPSLFNFIACGLLMCPGAPTIPSSSTDKAQRRDRIETVGQVKSERSGCDDESGEDIGEDGDDFDSHPSIIFCGSQNEWPSHQQY
jgi:hypothetical protein